jgi:hypothetical protein
MTFNWYLLFNLDEFLDSGLVSKELDIVLEDIGQKKIMITQGNETSVVYEDVMLTIGANGENPVIQEGDESSYAAYLDSSQNVWLGIEAGA